MPADAHASPPSTTIRGVTPLGAYEPGPGGGLGFGGLVLLSVLVYAVRIF